MRTYNIDTHDARSIRETLLLLSVEINRLAKDQPYYTVYGRGFKDGVDMTQKLIQQWIDDIS